MNEAVVKRDQLLKEKTRLSAEITDLNAQIATKNATFDTAQAAADATMPYSDWAKQIKIEVDGKSFDNNNLYLICGTYSVIPKNASVQPHDNLYKHSEQSNIFLKFDMSDNFWVIFYRYEDTPTIREITLAKTKDVATSRKIPKEWIIRKSDIIEQIVQVNNRSSTIIEQIRELSSFLKPASPLENILENDIAGVQVNNKNSASEITFTITELGEIYLPQDHEQKDLSVVFTKKVEDKRTFVHYNTTEPPITEVQSGFTRVGTIYKSIHHNYYYKYFSKSANSVIDDAETTPYNPDQDFKDMFPFITLYRRDGYNPYGSDNQLLVYTDVISWYRENDERIRNLGV